MSRTEKAPELLSRAEMEQELNALCDRLEAKAGRPTRDAKLAGHAAARRSMGHTWLGIGEALERIAPTTGTRKPSRAALEKRARRYAAIGEAEQAKIAAWMAGEGLAEVDAAEALDRLRTRLLRAMRDWEAHEVGRKKALKGYLPEGS